MYMLWKHFRPGRVGWRMTITTCSKLKEVCTREYGDAPRSMKNIVQGGTHSCWIVHSCPRFDCAITLVTDYIDPSDESLVVTRLWCRRAATARSCHGTSVIASVPPPFHPSTHPSVRQTEKKFRPEKNNFCTPCFSFLERQGIVDLGGVATRDGV